MVFTVTGYVADYNWVFFYEEHYERLSIFYIYIDSFNRINIFGSATLPSLEQSGNADVKQWDPSQWQDSY